MHKLMLILTVLTIGIVYGGCNRQEETTTENEPTEMKEGKSEAVVSEIEQKVEKIHEEVEKKEESKAPDEIANDLWKLIETENFRDRWRMWPGKEALYQGTPPHGALLTTYINSIGYESVVKKENVLPSGTIIVNEDYMPDKTLAAITVMYNLPGFDPEHGNWFWGKYAPDGKPMTMEKDGETVILAGAISDCIGCHSASSSGIQYIMTGSK